MRPLFPGSMPSAPLPDPDRAVLLRRPLAERILETLHYLAEEIEPRRVGSLGEAQAAGYIAGRLRRVEQQAVVRSFHSNAPPSLALLLVLLATALAFAIPLLLAPPYVPFAGATSAVLAALAAGLFVDEQAGSAILAQVLGRPVSQSVVGVRGATATTAPRTRAIVVAPLDGPPRSPTRGLSRTVLGLLVLQTLAYAWLVLAQRWPWHALLSVLLGTTGCLILLMVHQQTARVPQPAVLGAGELATLIGVAEELSALEHTEVWTVAAGAAATGDASLRHLLRHYPFDHTTAIINLDRITGGSPVYATREGVLRERRANRQLLSLASAADAHDMRINAEPRPLRRRTLAHLPLRRGFAVITVTSHPDIHTLASPEVDTIARCVYLVVGMLRELDAGGGVVPTDVRGI
ncbi:MAG: hypothetical protein H0X37_24065 [Herpetosiphonaceae bacterium]|nr:hypothetical protein [Herpetosiphonaceae bacterium]